MCLEEANTDVENDEDNALIIMAIWKSGKARVSSKGHRRVVTVVRKFWLVQRMQVSKRQDVCQECE